MVDCYIKSKEWGKTLDLMRENKDMVKEKLG
jgi:hypothetical protein